MKKTEKIATFLCIEDAGNTVPDDIDPNRDDNDDDDGSDDGRSDDESERVIIFKFPRVYTFIFLIKFSLCGD